MNSQGFATHPNMVSIVFESRADIANHPKTTRYVHRVQACISALCSDTPNPWGTLHRHHYLRHHHYGHYSHTPQLFIRQKHKPSLIYPTNTYLHTTTALQPPAPAPIRILKWFGTHTELGRTNQSSECLCRWKWLHSHIPHHQIGLLQSQCLLRTPLHWSNVIVDN